MKNQTRHLSRKIEIDNDRHDIAPDFSLTRYGSDDIVDLTRYYPHRGPGVVALELRNLIHALPKTVFYLGTGFPPAPFVPVDAAAKRANLRTTAHAGESGPTKNVRALLATDAA